MTAGRDRLGRPATDEVLALFDVMLRHPVPPYPAMGVRGARAAVEASVRMQTPSDGDVHVETLDLGGREPVPVRLYTPLTPAPEGRRDLLVHVHGGGWMTGSVDVADNGCRDLAAATGCVVASVDYRLSPEAPFPAAYDDTLCALDELSSMRSARGWSPARLVLVGDSAGGNLVAAVSQARRELVTDVVLMYPALDDSRGSTLSSRHENAHDPVLPATTMDWFWDHYVRAPLTVDDDPRAYPLRATDLSSMPRTVIVTCSLDVLRDEGRAYADRLREARSPVDEVLFDGMVHGFWWMSRFLPQARELTEVVAAWLRAPH